MARCAAAAAAAAAVLLAALVCVVSARPCTPQDAYPVLGACDANHSRVVALAWSADCVPDAHTPLPNSFGSVPCECTVLDYAQEFSACVNGLVNVTFVKRTDCSDGLTTPEPLLNQACVCPVPMYTQCDMRTNTRSLVYYGSRTRVCLGNYTSVPAPVDGIPCDVECGGGEYLPAGQSTCATCGAGSYSIGGGRRYTAWSSWPDGMTSSCTSKSTFSATKACSPWTLNGTFISSGANEGAGITVSSLEYNVDLVLPGHVRFVYMVDTAFWGSGLTFSVDGVAWDRDVDDFEYRYVEYSAPLAAGFHQLRWDFEVGSTSSGANYANIRELEVTGTSYNEFECQLCSPGFFSAAKASECTPCPANHYSSGYGATSCDACADDEFTMVGASSCTKRPACVPTDYTSYYTPCEGGKRNLRYRMIDPVTCDVAHLVLPEEQIGLDCAPCQPGTVLNAATHTCDPCPVGSYSSAVGASACSECGAGSAAPLAMHWTAFDAVPVNFSTGCDQECATEGWYAYNQTLTPGEGHGRAALLWLELDVTFAMPGRVSFVYEFINDDYSAYFRFLVDNQVRADSYTISSTQGRVRLEYAVAAGKHSLRWVLQKMSSGDSLVRLYEVVVRGVTSGGADNCTACPVGTYAAAHSSTCTVCSAGTASTAARTSCAQCAANTFTAEVGASACTPCGEGTYSAAGATTCDTHCTLSVGGKTYDLSPLERADTMYGPIRDNNTAVYYFLNVCTRSSGNHTCTDASGNALPLFACQHTSAGWSVDIGSLLHILPLPDGSEGVRISYTNGRAGCGTRRSTNITLVCDPTAGVGEPTRPPGDVVEVTPCHYEFVWRSLYACPLCTDAHYTYVNGGCVGGQTVTTYFWNNPKRCHGGEPLPDDFALPCSEIGISQSLLALVIVTAIGVVGALVVLIVCLCVRHRRLAYRYSRLQNQTEELGFMSANEPAPSHLLMDGDDDADGSPTGAPRASVDSDDFAPAQRGRRTSPSASSAVAGAGAGTARAPPAARRATTGGALSLSSGVGSTTPHGVRAAATPRVSSRATAPASASAGAAALPAAPTSGSSATAPSSAPPAGPGARVSASISARAAAVRNLREQLRGSGSAGQAAAGAGNADRV